MMVPLPISMYCEQRPTPVEISKIAYFRGNVADGPICFAEDKKLELKSLAAAKNECRYQAKMEIVVRFNAFTR